MDAPGYFTDRFAWSVLNRGSLGSLVFLTSAIGCITIISTVLMLFILLSYVVPQITKA